LTITSDSRVINAASVNDEIHLFYRDIHHTPFVYYGEVFLKEHKVLTTEPSQFVFSIGNQTQAPDLFEEIESHENEYKSLDRTDKDSIIKSRIGQGIFRDGVIQLWGSCAVTDLKNLSVLRASHIKPWRDSTNQERLDPLNGLLLQPTLDHLFDMGLITFGNDGIIRISDKLSKEDILKLHLSNDVKLHKLPEGVMPYMEYHRNYIFNNG
jgi:predicted restriction endonuclease